MSAIRSHDGILQPLADALADGDEHLRDLDLTRRARFIPARFQWQVNPRTHALTLAGGEFL